jgi:hypothetical protein
MAKRDPNKTAINKRINKISSELKELLPNVLKSTGIRSVQSLHGLIGHKNEYFIDVRNEIIYSEEEYVTLWLSGLRDAILEIPLYYRDEDNSRYYIYKLIQRNCFFRDYLYLFLQRTFIRNMAAYTKARPKVEESEIWIGQNNADYGILITPRFNGKNWENDKSEIRHFSAKYWSIGHILETGILVPFSNDVFSFNTIEEYLNFFTNVIVRNSGSIYEYEIAKKYSNFVLNHTSPKDIPLLIPEYRYKGIEKKHEHRLDFTIIQSEDLNKIGFELSPWSTHGQLIGTKKKTQKLINEEASHNFNKEVVKLRKYFKKYNIYTLVYSDESLKDLNLIFDDMKLYLEPKSSNKQLKLQIYDEILNSKL